MTLRANVTAWSSSPLGSGGRRRRTCGASSWPAASPGPRRPPWRAPRRCCRRPGATARGRGPWPRGLRKSRACGSGPRTLRSWPRPMQSPRSGRGSGRRGRLQPARRAQQGRWRRRSAGSAALRRRAARDPQLQRQGLRCRWKSRPRRRGSAAAASSPRRRPRRPPRRLRASARWARRSARRSWRRRSRRACGAPWPTWPAARRSPARASRAPSCWRRWCRAGAW
mmetsp:Transcript_74171/g.239874  ORF Transcript_74171/g.239874 Transcript_74171/m.239874 type:complete len:225 (-) Transcript_74171:107-781(-)